MSAPALLISALATLAQAPVPAALELGVPALEAAVPPIVPFAEIAAEPESFLGAEVRLLFQYHSERKSWNPYMTGFAPGLFRSLDGWTDEQRLWIQSDFDAPAARVFVRRGSKADAALRDVLVHQRWTLAGIVREEFLGRPWIEITHAYRMREHVPEGSVLHVIRAFELIDRKVFNLARDEFTRALAAPLPAHVARELEAWRAHCSRRLGPVAKPASSGVSPRASTEAIHLGVDGRSDGPD